MSATIQTKQVQMSVDAQSSQMFAAAKKGNWKMIEELIEAGFNVNASDLDDQTLLLVAIRSLEMMEDEPAHWSNIAVFHHVAYLLIHGADPNSKDNTLCQYPLNEAIIRGKIDIVKALLQYGADPNRLIDDPNCPFDGTALHVAAYMGETEIAYLLLKNMADVNARGSAGQTPLHAAALDGRLNVAEVLISHGADINAICLQSKNNYLQYETPLHLSVAFLHPGMVHFLLSKGAIIDKKNCCGFTPLDMAQSGLFRALVFDYDVFTKNVNAILAELKRV